MDVLFVSGVFPFFYDITQFASKTTPVTIHPFGGASGK
jgi:hypothetical protein